jgi:hypothetical protein
VTRSAIEPRRRLLCTAFMAPAFLDPLCGQ